MTESAQKETAITLPSDRELVMTRAFHAPARVLFEVWTKPEHVRKWYGVRGTTVTVCDIDLRVGGAWRWVISRPGMEVAFSGVFLEIDPPHRLKRTEVFEGMPGATCDVTLSFEEMDGETTLVTHMLFPSKMHRDGAMQSGMDKGVRECYQKIDEIGAG